MRVFHSLFFLLTPRVQVYKYPFTPAPGIGTMCNCSMTTATDLNWSTEVRINADFVVLFCTYVDKSPLGSCEVCTHLSSIFCCAWVHVKNRYEWMKCTIYIAYTYLYHSCILAILKLHVVQSLKKQTFPRPTRNFTLINWRNSQINKAF